ncbi:MaoC/PaaZ C-terminal domain-containing protein [Advenella sp. RU8]|uniref:MaoC/PaaZ C-terminal domain-containing protein n=1 Tax=Advenella sp. RU8 TaxID=3399575 RepID=UPI003AAF9F55
MNIPESFNDLVSYDLGSKEVVWDQSTLILYAIACGASANDLELVYEEGLKALPSFVSTLGLWAVEKCGDLGVYDRQKSLHVSQYIEIKKTIPVQARVVTNARVEGVWDKGRATIVDIVVESEYFIAKYAIFLPGIGGWGGEDAPKAAAKVEVPLEKVGSYQTTENQAILYRLTGDLHPVHVNFEVARAYGFAKPILHGLCTFGIALRLLATVMNISPETLQTASAKLSAPVLPGENLTLYAARVEAGYVFEMRVDDKVVLKEGQAAFLST